MPKSMVNTSNVHYSVENHNQRRYIEKLSFTNNIDSRMMSSLELMFLSSEVIHFRSIVDPKANIAEFPDELKRFVYSAGSPVREVRRECLASGC